MLAPKQPHLLRFFFCTIFLPFWNPTDIVAERFPDFRGALLRNGTGQLRAWKDADYYRTGGKNINRTEQRGVFNVKSTEGEDIDFEYRRGSEKGPEQWGDLKEEWRTCKEGKMQSPIDIRLEKTTKVCSSLKDLSEYYKPANATIKNEEHAISVVWEGDDGFIQINGTAYFLKQCHWHSPSEHTINGRRYHLELHMVHKSKDNAVAVTGVLYKLGRPNSFISQVTDHIISMIDVKHAIKMGATDPRRLRAYKRAPSQFYRYMGSLTTPPCAEGVIWTINQEVQTVSLSQVKLLQEAVFDHATNNARPLQPLNCREVKFYGTYH